MEKTLVDIRYYASDMPNEPGRSLPSNCSQFFDFPKSFHFWGARIARVLGGQGLSLGDFDHLYLNYTSAIPEDSLALSERRSEKWLRYLDFGVSFDHLKSLNESELEGFVIHSTFKCLEYICNVNAEQCKLIRLAAMDIERFGTEIELPVKTKKTKSYSISIFYKLQPKDDVSHGIIKYLNYKTGVAFTKRFIDLKGPSDIFPLIGNISVKAQKIQIKPRTSFSASLYSNAYQVPIEIDINESADA